jgi:hypothetical protein
VPFERGLVAIAGHPDPIDRHFGEQVVDPGVFIQKVLADQDRHAADRRDEDMQAVSDLSAFGADVVSPEQTQLAMNKQPAPAACEHRRRVVGQKRVRGLLRLVKRTGDDELDVGGVLPKVGGDLVPVLKVQRELWEHHDLRGGLGCCGELLKH